MTQLNPRKEGTYAPHVGLFRRYSPLMGALHHRKCCANFCLVLFGRWAPLNNRLPKEGLESPFCPWPLGTWGGYGLGFPCRSAMFAQPGVRLKQPSTLGSTPPNGGRTRRVGCEGNQQLTKLVKHPCSTPQYAAPSESPPKTPIPHQPPAHPNNTPTPNTPPPYMGKSGVFSEAMLYVKPT